MTLIACVQIPQFPIAVARRDTPALADTPLLLYTAAQSRAIVYAAACETNVPAGMRLQRALLASPHAVCRPATPERDEAVFTALVSRIAQSSPRVAASTMLPDAVVELDLGRSTVRKARIEAEGLSQTLRTDPGLAVALGLARNRFVARMAATIAGAGSTVLVPPGAEAAFLAPLPIRLLPFEPHVHERLANFGLHTIGAVAELPIDALLVQFGIEGRRLHQLATGQDEQGIPANAPAACLEVVRRFEGALSDRMSLEAALRALARELVAQLERGGWAARDIVLCLTPPDGAPWVERRVLNQATADPERLTQALLALLGRASCPGGVELLSIQVRSVQPTVAVQSELFVSQQAQSDRLQNVLQRLSVRHSGAFLRARLSDAFAPEQRAQFEQLA
jgi:nucleotidyltransferase/DNA polymerase involved in DNA repair